MGDQNHNVTQLLSKWGWERPGGEIKFLAMQAVACRQLFKNPFRIAKAILATQEGSLDFVDIENYDAAAGTNPISVGEFAELSKLGSAAISEIYSMLLEVPYIKGLGGFQAADILAADEDLRELCEKENLTIVRSDAGAIVVCPTIQKLDELSAAATGDASSVISFKLVAKGVATSFATAEPNSIAEHRKLALKSMSIDTEHRAIALASGIKPLIDLIAKNDFFHISLDTDSLDVRWITSMRARTASGEWERMSQFDRAQLVSIASALKSISQQAGCTFINMTKRCFSFQTGVTVNGESYLIDFATAPTLAGRAMVNLTFLNVDELVNSDAAVHAGIKMPPNQSVSIATIKPAQVADPVARYARAVATTIHECGVDAIAFMLCSPGDSASAKSISAVAGSVAIYCPSSREDMTRTAKALAASGKKFLAIGNVSHDASSEAFAITAASMGVTVIGYSHYADIKALDRQLHAAAAEFGVPDQIAKNASTMLNEI